MIAQLDRELARQAPSRAAARLAAYLLFEGRPLTTRGRWWNPVTFANLRLAMKLPIRRVTRPIFIVGMGRSGTTLLGRLLSIHPEVGFLNEPKALWHLVRDDEDIIGSYGQPDSGRLTLDAADASPAVVRRAHAMSRWFQILTGTHRVVDKYPELVFRRQFVNEIYPDAKYLVVTRSPWPTLDSVAQWSAEHSQSEADWWGLRDQKWRILWRDAVVGRPENGDLARLDLEAEGDHVIRAAVEWIVTMREALTAVVDDNAAIVNYDRLLDAPDDEMRKVLDFCELAPSLRTERYCSMTVTSGRPHKASPRDFPRVLHDIVIGVQARLAAAGGCSPPGQAS